jgi:hypothetical protein
MLFRGVSAILGPTEPTKCAKIGENTETYLKISK